MEEKNSHEQKTSLLNRLVARFYNPKIARRLSGLLLVGAMMLTSAGCDWEITVKPKDPNQTNPPITDTNPGDTTTTNPGIQLEQYSELLQNVLTNEYYNYLIDSARGGNYDLYTSGKFQPHPYAFLEDEGFDIEAIENKQLDCYTMSYVLDEEPNNLYMYTRVNDGSVVHNYLLKYELTDQEMKDYDMTHNAPTGATNYYVQAVFMNNEISEMKTPTIVGTSKMTLKAFEGMTETMTGRYNLETEKCDIIMTNPDPKNYYFNLKLIPYFYESKQMTFNCSIADLNCKATIIYENYVFKSPYTFGSFRPNSYTSHSATLYFTQRANLNLERCKDLVE